MFVARGPCTLGSRSCALSRVPHRWVHSALHGSAKSRMIPTPCVRQTQFISAGCRQHWSQVSQQRALSTKPDTARKELTDAPGAGGDPDSESGAEPSGGADDEAEGVAWSNWAIGPRATEAASATVMGGVTAMANHLALRAKIKLLERDTNIELDVAEFADGARHARSLVHQLSSEADFDELGGILSAGAIESMKAFAAERASDGLGIELGNATCTHLLLAGAQWLNSAHDEPGHCTLAIEVEFMEEDGGVPESSWRFERQVRVTEPIVTEQCQADTPTEWVVAAIQHRSSPAGSGP